MTEGEVIFYDPKLTGVNKTEIPFAQVMSATYTLNWGVPSFSVTTQSGTNELMLGGQKKDVHEPALALFNLLREKLSEMAAVPISETHNKGPLKETWSFYAPPQLAVMQSVPKTKESEEDIPGKIQKLSDLHKAGVLSSNEFESKKAELLKRF